MKAPIERRIFVVGAARSGTTLVQTLLASHSALTSFTESHFFDRHFARLPLASRPVLVRSPWGRVREFLLENGVQPTEVESWLASTGSLTTKGPLYPLQTFKVGRQLLSLLDGLAQQRGKSGWIEKTPRHLRYVPFLEQLSRDVGQTHFVHVIRQGADVVASLHLASQHWERHYSVDECVRRWNEDLRLSLGRVASAVDHFVFYEEVTADPQGTLRSLLFRLGLDWQPGMLERLAETSGTVVTAEEVWKQNLGDHVRRGASSLGRLTPDDRDRVAAALDSDLYERVRSAARATAGHGQRMVG